MALIKALEQDFQGDVLYKGPVTSEEIRLPQYQPQPNALASVRNKLQSQGWEPSPPTMKLILVNPNASDVFPLRKWPLESFVALCSRLLSARPNLWIAMTGTSSEAETTARLVRLVNDRRCFNLAGKTSFEELLALYSLASVLVTNDSGPAHFAALVNLPTVVLFGPESPRLYAPLGKHVRCLYAGFACSPCISVYNNKKSPCRDNLCLKAISVDEVADATLAQLALTA